MKVLKKIRYNSPVVLTFAILSLIVLLLDFITKGSSTRHFFSVYRSSFFEIGSYIRVFGHVLGHSGIEHYMGNMVLFLVVGPPLEEKYGSKTLLSAMIITAVVSGIVHCLISPNTALLGASGIVFMFIMMSSLAGMQAGTIPLTMILVAVIYIGGEIVAGFSGNDGISQLTHIIGGLCGTGIGMVLAREKRT